MPGCLQAPSQAMSGVATGPRSFWTKSPAGRRRGNEEGLAQEPRAAGSTAGGRGHSPRWQLIPITAAGWALPPRKEQTAHSWEWSPRPGPSPRFRGASCRRELPSASSGACPLLLARRVTFISWAFASFRREGSSWGVVAEEESLSGDAAVRTSGRRALEAEAGGGGACSAPWVTARKRGCRMHAAGPGLR